ncbi:unnamed protein product [Dibothriocephalus latus]|uniref:long-chain-fatty-acid--CoA ligase n=1 Tax=Dibothriocephalus latus TaxID=60516 RepID=A0A3P6SNJ6_DIBLA|nr:unnamed protein product [Dibothriocephalus latus]
MVLSVGSALRRIDELVSRTPACVGIYAADCPEWIISELSCWSYGLVAVPLYDTLGEEAIHHICKQTNISLIICDTPIKARKLITKRHNLDCLKGILIIRPEGQLSELQAEAGDGLQICDFYEFMPAGVDELLLICYTSGTTGMPKGVTLTNRAILGTLAGMIQQTPELLVLYAGGRIGYSLGGLPTLMQDLVALRPTLFAGVPRLLVRIYEAVHAKMSSHGWQRIALEWAVDSQLTLADKQIYYDGSLYDKLLFSKMRESFGGNLRAVITGSAPISPTILRFTRALFNCPVLEGYGSTEACGVLTLSVAGDLNGGHVGTPVSSVALKLMDVPEMELVAERDNKGEICWKSVGGTSGYFKRPEMTAELIDQYGWMHTGDIGMWINGSLKIIDRCKQIFKLSQGEYVAPEKVELVYQESPLIANVFVDGSPLSSFPVAIIVPDKQGVLKALNGNGEDIKNCSLRSLCESSLVKTLIFKDCIHLGEKAKLKGFEKVKNIYLTPRAFTIENGLLTPTLKASRHAIRKCYAKELELMQKQPMS